MVTTIRPTVTLDSLAKVYDTASYNISRYIYMYDVQPYTI
jgi:hypothetical protein